MSVVVPDGTLASSSLRRSAAISSAGVSSPRRWQAADLFDLVESVSTAARLIQKAAQQ
jgi:hypothetical protein